jgi:hypothetical protein
MRKYIFTSILILGLFLTQSVFADWSFNYGYNKNANFNNQSVGLTYNYLAKLNTYPYSFPVFNVVPFNFMEDSNFYYYMPYNMDSINLYQYGAALIYNNDLKKINGFQISLDSTTSLINMPYLVFNSGIGFVYQDNDINQLTIKIGAGANFNSFLVSFAYDTYRGILVEVSLVDLQKEIDQKKTDFYERKIKKLTQIKNKIDEDINNIKTEKLKP